MPGELPVPPIPDPNAFSVLTYLPRRSNIASITQANPAVVTTTSDHQLISQEIVRLYIPLEYGMQQINEQAAEIIVLDDTSFSIAIDSTAFDSFAVPGSPEQQAQVVPIAENNSILTAATRNIL